MQGKNKDFRIDEGTKIKAKTEINIESHRKKEKYQGLMRLTTARAKGDRSSGDGRHAGIVKVELQNTERARDGEHEGSEK